MLLAKTVINKISPEANIEEAHDGAEALEKCSYLLPDIIFMDIQLPGMNGYEATQKIRKKYAQENILIIALTAGNVKGERKKCLDAGMDDFIAKPFVEKDLVNLMEKWSIDALTPPQNHASEEVQEPSSFDLNWFREFLGEELSDELIVQSLLKTSLNELVKTKKLLVKARDEVDLKQMKAIGHKLYGSSCSLGLKKLAKLSAELETFPTENPEEMKLNELVEKVLQMMDRNIREIETHMVQE